MLDSELDAVESVPMSEEEIERIVATVTHPHGEAILNDRRATLIENRRLRSQLAAVTAERNAAKGEQHRLQYENEQLHATILIQANQLAAFDRCLAQQETK